MPDVFAQTCAAEGDEQACKRSRCRNRQAFRRGSRRRMQLSDKAKGLHLNRGDNKPQPCRHKCVGQFMNRKRNKGKHEGGQLTEHGRGGNKQQNANRTAKFGSAENGNLQLPEIRLDAKKIKRIDRPPCLGDFDANIVTLHVSENAALNDRLPAFNANIPQPVVCNFNIIRTENGQAAAEAFVK